MRSTWKIYALTLIFALLVVVGLGVGNQGRVSIATPRDTSAPVLPTIAASDPIHVVGYWEPGGEVVGVVNVSQREILAQRDVWVQVRVDGDGVVWVQAGELLEALGETAQEAQP